MGGEWVIKARIKVFFPALSNSAVFKGFDDVHIHLKCKDPPGEQNAKSEITKKAKQTQKTTATARTKRTVIRNTKEKKKSKSSLGLQHLL